LIDRWIDVIYHQRRHGGIGMPPVVRAGQSPVAARYIEDERALDILLAPAGEAVVGKKGIRHQREQYTAAEMPGWIGERVQVRVDPTCAGTLHTFDHEGRYLFTARNESLAGQTAAEYAAARKAQRRAENEKRRAIEKLDHDPMMQLLDAEGAKPGRLRELPRRKRMNNEQLDEAWKAAQQRHGKTPPGQEYMLDQMRADGRKIAPGAGNDDDLADFWERIEVR